MLNTGLVNMTGANISAGWLCSLWERHLESHFQSHFGGVDGVIMRFRDLVWRLAGLDGVSSGFLSGLAYGRWASP